MTFKSKRRAMKPSNKYLKPGALAQLRYNLSTARCCTDIGKKRIVLVSKDDKVSSEKNTGGKRIMLDSEERMVQFPLAVAGSQSIMPAASSMSTNFSSPAGSQHATRQVKLMDSPRTPLTADTQSYSGLESLPIELLVKILCHLHHDQLKAVFHVSQRIRSAVIIARQTYFNYTTPDRSRLEMLRIQTPRPTERWPFKRGEGRHEAIRPTHTESSATRPPASSPSLYRHQTGGGCTFPGFNDTLQLHGASQVSKAWPEASGL